MVRIRNSIVVIAVAAMILAAAVPHTTALAPAKKPNWQIGDSWTYHGQVVIIVTIVIDYTLNITGKGEINVDGSTYPVFMLDFTSTAKVGALVTTYAGTHFYTQDDFGLIRTRTTTGERTTLVTYDPPRREVDFPLELSKEWEDSYKITTVETSKSGTTTTVVNESTTYTVSAIETIETTNDQFECYRISAVNKTGQTVNYWYSASAGEFVKLIFNAAMPGSYITLTDYSYSPGGGGGGGGQYNSMLLLGLIGIIMVVVVIVAVIVIVATRKPQVVMVQPVPVAQPIQPAPQPAATIEDVFLIYKDGRLIHHDARRLRPEVDQDVLGGMLTAIQEFVSRSFPSTDGTPSSVKEIRYANNRILLENGRFLFLAVVTDMKETASLQTRMAAILRLMESKCQIELQNWDGNIESLAEAKRLARLMLTDEPVPVQ